MAWLMNGTDVAHFFIIAIKTSHACDHGMVFFDNAEIIAFLSISHFSLVQNPGAAGVLLCWHAFFIFVCNAGN